MLRARHNAWAVNYDRRERAKAMGADRCGFVLRIIERYDFPMPQMELSGWLDKEASGLLASERCRDACDAAGLPRAEYEMLARWYWSLDEWQMYVRSFNELPDPQGQYVFSWEGRLLPKVAPIGAVDNSGTSGGNSALVPIPRELIQRGMKQ